MNQVSVEYAHIYTNQHISEEHELSVDILNKAKAEISDQGKALSLVVMVDDYSFPDPTFSYDDFSIWLTEKGYSPDLMIRESQLIPLCDKVVSFINDEELKSQITDYIQAKKYPCSLFIASWYLLRLGKISADYFPKEQISSELLNILPQSFKPFEDKGIEIIRATEFKECVALINYRFIPGRLIA
jgi:hypothetical protein